MSTLILATLLLLFGVLLGVCFGIGIWAGLKFTFYVEEKMKEKETGPWH